MVPDPLQLYTACYTSFAGDGMKMISGRFDDQEKTPGTLYR
jgi:hypothetical protein